MSDEKKLSPNDVIIHILRLLNANQISKIYEYATRYSSQLAHGGNVRYTLQRVISEQPKSFKTLNELNGSVKNLVNISHQLPNEHVFMDQTVSDFVRNILQEWRHADLYKKHNLGIRNRLILHGPTGNGKTTLAKYISSRAELPFVNVLGDAVLDSHMGTTGRNIYTLFSTITQPCVIFWDEFDSVAKKRSGDDSSIGYETDRIVNSILVNLEKLSEDVIFIAATNRYELLDPAIKRRFNADMVASAPNDWAKNKYKVSLLRHHKLNDDMVDVDALKYNSYSEIKQAVIEAAREYVFKMITKSNDTVVTRSGAETVGNEAQPR